MEANAKSIGVLNNLPLISLVMPYYDYAYDCVVVLKSLCKKSQELCNNNEDAISRMMIKQTAIIYHENIDELTCNMLNKNNKYKLFKFRFEHMNQYNTRHSYKLLFQMLDEMPQIEIEQLEVQNEDFDVLNNLAVSVQFKTTRDFYNTLINELTLINKLPLRNDLHPKIIAKNHLYHTYSIHKSQNCLEYTYTPFIYDINEDFNIDWELNKIKIMSN